MLYIFYGTDIETSRQKAAKLVDSLRTKKPDAAYVRIDSDHWHPTILEEHIGGQGLFSNKYILFLDRLSADTEIRDVLVDSLETLQTSANIFVILEGKVLADTKKAFEKHAEKTVVSDLGERPISKEFNVFALADAITTRDRVKAWTIYRDAIDLGHEPEALAGTLFWQAKSIYLTYDASSAVASGLSPFVFTKSKKATTKYSSAEMNIFMNELISTYHDAHRGLVSLELGIEQLLLKL